MDETNTLPPTSDADTAEAKGSSLDRMVSLPPVLDACCGSRMFWFDRKTPQAIFVDKRTENHVLCDGRKLEIAPDVQADFTDLPFPDATFYLVVFDPPHMTTLGANSWMAKKYGRLTGDWKPMLKAGFEECFRVLKPNGTLVFKWNQTDVKLKEVLELSPIPPLFGHTTGRQAKTVWATFLKPKDNLIQGGEEKL